MRKEKEIKRKNKWVEKWRKRGEVLEIKNTKE